MSTQQTNKALCQLLGITGRNVIGAKLTLAANQAPQLEVTSLLPVVGAIPDTQMFEIALIDQTRAAPAFDLDAMVKGAERRLAQDLARSIQRHRAEMGFDRDAINYWPGVR